MEQSIEHSAPQPWESTVGPAGMRIVKLLVGKAPQTIAELTEATGVTRTAVTEQLHDLVSSGFAQRCVERLPGRGRPRHRFSVTTAAMLHLFAGNQQLLVPAMWRAIAEIGGEGLRSRVCNSVAREMAAHYGRLVKGKTPSVRFREMAELLSEEGDVVEVADDSQGRPVMRRRNCGFFSMFEASRSVCRVDEAMIRRVVGAPVRRTACRHDGSPCCEFTLMSSNGH